MHALRDVSLSLPPGVLAVVATHDPLSEMADHLVELGGGEVVGEDRRAAAAAS